VNRGSRYTHRNTLEFVDIEIAPFVGDSSGDCFVDNTDAVDRDSAENRFLPRVLDWNLIFFDEVR
jgi:hypothetical protein